MTLLKCHFHPIFIAFSKQIIARETTNYCHFYLGMAMPVGIRVPSPTQLEWDGFYRPNLDIKKWGVFFSILNSDGSGGNNGWTRSINRELFFFFKNNFLLMTFTCMESIVIRAIPYMWNQIPPIMSTWASKSIQEVCYSLCSINIAIEVVFLIKKNGFIYKVHQNSKNKITIIG